MNLHRSSATPDWEQIEPSSHTFFQKIAAVTNGVITPANLISLIGLGLVLYGIVAIIYQQFWLGFIFIGIGRLLDIADGAVAEATQTKSPLGEMVDAVADKIGTFLTAFVLIYAASSYWWVVVALLLPQVFIPLVIFYKKQKKVSVHPTVQGKLSMALTWVGIGGIIIAQALGGNSLLVTAVYGVTAVSLLLGFWALWQYATGRD